MSSIVAQDISNAVKYGSVLDDEYHLVGIPTGATIGMKFERTIFAFFYCFMLFVACMNVWNYLYKKQMYKSFPMSMAYFILIIYSLIGIVYELFMNFFCGSHDCISTMYAL